MGIQIHIPNPLHRWQGCGRQGVAADAAAEIEQFTLGEALLQAQGVGDVVSAVQVPGRQFQQDAVVARGDGLEHAGHGDVLIEADLPVAALVEIGDGGEAITPGVLRGKGAVPQFLRRGEAGGHSAVSDLPRLPPHSMRPGVIANLRRMRLPSTTPHPAAASSGSINSAQVSASFMPRASVSSKREWADSHSSGTVTSRSRSVFYHIVIAEGAGRGGHGDQSGASRRRYSSKPARSIWARRAG